MDMIENVDRSEVQELRRMLDVLNRRLEKELVVNEKMIRRAMREKVGGLRKRGRFIRIVGLFGLFYCPFALYFLGFSWWFNGVTELFFGVAVGYDYYTYRGLRIASLPDSNMLDIARAVVRVKQRNASWLKFGIPFILIWLSWFSYELLNMNSDQEFLYGELIGGGVGCVIGLIAGISHYLATRREADEVLRQIEDFTSVSQ